MRTSLIAAAALALATPAFATDAFANSYSFDPTHTEVLASWNHLGLSEQSLEFLAVDGEVIFNQDDVPASSLSVTIPVESIHSGVAKFDEHLKGGDFFDLANHPNVTFVSTAARQTGANTGEIEGDLTIKGVTQPATLDVVFNFAGPHPLSGIVPGLEGVEAAGFTATTAVNRSDFGMGAYAPSVSDRIEIVINAELKKTD